MIYSGNVTAYQLFCWNKEAGNWKLIGNRVSARTRKIAFYDQLKSEMLQFEHRVKCKTDKIKLVVGKTQSDGLVTTTTPSKDDKIVNQRIEYIGTGRQRKSIYIYSIYVYSMATIREIEIYSHIKN